MNPRHSGTSPAQTTRSTESDNDDDRVAPFVHVSVTGRPLSGTAPQAATVVASPLAALRRRFPTLVPSRGRPTRVGADVGSGAGFQPRSYPKTTPQRDGSGRPVPRTNSVSVEKVAKDVVCTQYVTPHSVAVLTLAKLYVEHLAAQEKTGTPLDADNVSKLLLFVAAQLRTALTEPSLRSFLDQLEALDGAESSSSIIPDAAGSTAEMKTQSVAFFRRLRIRIQKHLVLARGSLDIFDSLIEHILSVLIPSSSAPVRVKPNSVLGIYIRQFRLEWLSLRASGQFSKVSGIFSAFSTYVSGVDSSSSHQARPSQQSDSIKWKTIATLSNESPLHFHKSLSNSPEEKGQSTTMDTSECRHGESFDSVGNFLMRQSPTKSAPSAMKVSFDTTESHGTATRTSAEMTPFKSFTNVLDPSNSPFLQQARTPGKGTSSSAADDRLKVRGSPFAYRTGDFSMENLHKSPTNKLFNAEMDLTTPSSKVMDHDMVTPGSAISGPSNYLYPDSADGTAISSLISIHGVLSAKQVKLFLEKIIADFSANSVCFSHLELNTCLSFLSKYYPENPEIDYVAYLNEQRVGNFEQAIDHLHRYFVFCAKQELFSGRTRSMHHYEMLAVASVLARAGSFQQALKMIEMAIPRAQVVKDQPCINLLHHWRFYIELHMCQPFGNMSSYYSGLLDLQKENGNKTMCVNQKDDTSAKDCSPVQKKRAKQDAENSVDAATTHIQRASAKGDSNSSSMLSMNEDRDADKFDVPKPLLDALYGDDDAEEGKEMEFLANRSNFSPGKNDVRLKSSNFAHDFVKSRMRQPFESVQERFKSQDIWNLNSNDKVIQSMVSRTREIGQIQLQFLNQMTEIFQAVDSATVDVTTLEKLQECNELMAERNIKGAYIGSLRLLQSYLWSSLGSITLASTYALLQTRLPVSEAPQVDALKGSLRLCMDMLNSGSDPKNTSTVMEQLRSANCGDSPQTVDHVNDRHLIDAGLFQIEFLYQLRRGEIDLAHATNLKILDQIGPSITADDLSNVDNMRLLRCYKLNVSKLQRKKGEYQLAFENIGQLVKETEPKSLSVGIDSWRKAPVATGAVQTVAEHIDCLLELADLHVECENPHLAHGHALRAASLAAACGLLYLRDKAIVCLAMALNQSGLATHALRLLDAHVASILRHTMDLWLRSKLLQVFAESIVLSLTDSVSLGISTAQNDISANKVPLAKRMLQQSSAGFKRLEDYVEANVSDKMLSYLL